MKVLAVLFLVLSISARAAFLSGTDVPLMDDAVVNENESFSFDTPAGQIMTVTVKSSMSKKEVIDFYKESLGALGWQQVSSTEYHRDQDELTLQVESKDHATILKLQLTFANVLTFGFVSCIIKPCLNKLFYSED